MLLQKAKFSFKLTKYKGTKSFFELVKTVLYMLSNEISIVKPSIDSSFRRKKILTLVEIEIYCITTLHCEY